MFRIGEFSKLTQVSVRMLRYYDEMGLLRPAHTEPRSGYRLYSADQIPDLNRILYLRDSGFQIAEIKKALVSDQNEIIKMLYDKQIDIEKAIQAEELKLRKIEQAKQAAASGGQGLYEQIFTRAVPACQVLSLRRVIPDYYGEGGLWLELSAFARKNRVEVSGSSFSIYHDKEYKEVNVDVELCVPVQTAGKNAGDFVYRKTEPVSEMACTMVYGDFSNIGPAYKSFAGWLQKNSQFHMLGPSRQIVHRGPWNEENTENYLTELQIPLEKDR
ncbi:MerR family transcriptional regulator [Anaerolentibacter hominis]|uniref:MerR family transcriptional regulator n=1 Tax=Anaerolentibacter hominis TaxID=3079009 RepID=UPI0031B7F21E